MDYKDYGMLIRIECCDKEEFDHVRFQIRDITTDDAFICQDKQMDIIKILVYDIGDVKLECGEKSKTLHIMDKDIYLHTEDFVEMGLGDLSVEDFAHIFAKDRIDNKRCN